MVLSDTEWTIGQRNRAERMRDRAYQPRFDRHVVLLSWAGGLAMGLTIALGQVMGCLHPPAGAVARLGVLFSRLHGAAEPYPHHWL